jgi:pyruvate dehydrogenase E2 component (dihydrolipoamide acetyltransferase)
VPYEFRLPDLGEGIREAQLLAWKVRPGQRVEAFQALCEVESAKAAVELTSPVAGSVRETRIAEGAIAGLGDVLVVIDTAEDEAEPRPIHDSPRVSSAVAGESGGWFGIVGAPTPPPVVSSAPEVQAAPFVRKLARDRGVRLEDVRGSGPHGRVRIADVEAHLAAQTAPVTRDVVPLQGLRRSIADHMLQAWRAAPQVTSMDLFDVTELVQARDLLAQTARADGTRLTFLPFFIKAAVEALKQVPEANAVVTDTAIELKRDFHIGIATAVPGGLVVPVLRHADRMSLLELAQELERIVEDARARRSTPTALSGSTFTITSYGGLPGGPLFATPILNTPEVAILGLGRIDLQPRVRDGQVVPRQCIGVSFTFDHRAMDGEGAGRFMAALKRYTEQPLELLLKLR